MKIVLSLSLLFCSFCAFTQTVIPKTVIVVKIAGGIHPVELDKDVIEGKTVYRFVFQNRSYQELSDIKSMSFDTAGLREISKGLITAQGAKSGDDILMDRFSISKTKIFVTWGAVLYRFNYDGGWCNLSEKDLKKLFEAINKEL